MVTAEEALSSNDPQVVKRLRGSLSTQVTCDINLLSKELGKQQEGKFDLQKISHQLIKIQRKKLHDHFEAVQKLHDRYISIRSEGEDEEAEEALNLEDINYMENITLRVCPILDNLNMYDEAMTNVTKMKSLSKSNQETRGLCIKAKSDFSLMYNKVLSEINSIEAMEHKSEAKSCSIQTLPTETLLRNLSSSFSDVKRACCKLKETGELDESKVALSYEDEYIKYIDLELKLKRYEQLRAPTGFSATVDTVEAGKAIPLKINKPDNLIFSGQARDFAAFKRDFLAIVVPHRDSSQIGIYLKQAIPEKHKHLISNKDLHEWRAMMDIIEDELATPKIIIDQTVGEIERMKTPTSDRAFIDFVDALEKIERDLTTLDQLTEIANTAMLTKLEAKLPTQINHDWTEKVINENLAKKTSSDKFSQFMCFLKKAKEMTKYNLCLSGGANKNLCFVTGTFAPQPQRDKKESRPSQSRGTSLPCLACNIDGATNMDSCMHNMASCLVWGSMPYQQRAAMVKCLKHPFSQDDHTTDECRRDSGKPCIHCKKENVHHSLLCPEFQVRRKSSANTAHSAPTHDSTSSSGVPNIDLPQTLLYATFTRTRGGKKLGTLMDNGSTDDYILNKTAKRLRLTGQPVELITEGFGGSETRINTKLYSVPIIDNKNRVHHLPCYGIDKITTDTVLPDVSSYQRLCRKFNVDPSEVQRPRKIELLISMRSSHLHPRDSDTIKIGGMKLASGPLGKVFGGTCSDLKFDGMKLACPMSAVQVDTQLPIRSTCLKAVVRQSVLSTPLKTDREILNFFDEEQIGIYCEPKCGDCKCGTCALGTKQMSLKDEKEYNRFKSLMYLDITGTHEDPGPYWRTSFPWTVEPHDLVDNKAAVLAVMRATEKKLSKNPNWRQIYEQQLITLVEKQFAREISCFEIDDWEKAGGKTFYIAHQMVVNPQNKTTPVRCCFNSSQSYKGYSLNASWELGPDLVNSLHAVLLRFRKDLVAAQGDITKMYYMVRITEKESWMQIFMWRFEGEENIRYFKMERLVMGNKPSASLSGVALSETAHLNNFANEYPAAFKALTKDAYVDNIFITAPDHKSLKSKIKDVEFVAGHGGFFFKPFIISGEDFPDVVIGVSVPAAVELHEEKALGLYWEVKRDLIYVKADLGKPGKNTRRGTPEINVIVEPDSHVTVAPKLTLRTCLSLHARPFDALGLVLPTRMIGNILFRETLQTLKKDKKGKIPWDETITGEMKDTWCDYFSMLTQLETIFFPRSYKPEGVNPTIKPDLCTLNDGNPNAYGTVGYARWTLMDGTYRCRLMLSKARLSPLSHKGETVRNELCGATLSARLKTWLQKNSEVEFGNFYHFLDSRIVKDMIVKESYGFNTFVGLRVAEVQQKTSLQDWQHIPSRYNISDILTKGVPPGSLGPDSEWQNGPSWLCTDKAAWPVTPITLNQTTNSMANMEQYLRKSKVLTSQISLLPGLDLLISRCSSLHKLLRCLAYVMRWRQPKRINLNSSVRPITASEQRDALSLIVAWEQKKLSPNQVQKLVPKVITKKLFNYSIEVSHTVVGSRIKNFPISFTGHSEEIPIIPYGDLAKLIVSYYHNRFHCEVDTIVTHTRNDFWIIKCRKIASSLDNKCIDCKLKRKHLASQVMGELPSYRTTMQPAFSTVGCDLWGPITIRDDVVKRGNRTTKKVWGVMFTCTATRAVYLDVACGISTEELLHALRRAMARCGNIRTIVSDPGTNFVGAARELRDWRDGWNKDLLVRFGSEHGIEFITIMANSQIKME